MQMQINKKWIEINYLKWRKKNVNLFQRISKWTQSQYVCVCVYLWGFHFFRNINKNKMKITFDKFNLWKFFIIIRNLDVRVMELGFNKKNIYSKVNVIGKKHDSYLSSNR